MELWLDTLDFDLIGQATTRFKLAGITTNPSILSQAQASLDITLAALLNRQPGCVAVQVTATTSINMVNQAKYLHQFCPDRIIIKIPVTVEGLQALKILADHEIPTMATAIFELEQIYLSILAGATYAAPYLGKIMSKGHAASDVMNRMLQSIKACHSPLKLIAASIQDTKQIMDCLLAGTHAITLPAATFKELLQNHPETNHALENFNRDWSNPGNKAKDNILC
jgi:TalC/MipB family fructose-6-phosphate aldolase